MGDFDETVSERCTLIELGRNYVDSKTFFAFALGCFAAGGIAFLLSGPPSPSKAPVPAASEAPAPAPAKSEDVPVTPDRVISPAGPVEEAKPVAVPVKKSGFTRASEASSPKPSPRGKAATSEAERPVVVAKVEEKPAPVSTAAPVTAAPAAPPVPVSQPLKVEIPPPPAPTEPAVVAKKEVPAPPPPPKANTVTIAAGTMLSIRLQEALSTDRNMAGDTFQAVLEQPVIVDGLVIAEKGSRVEGKVLESDRGGKVKGTSRLVLEVTRINTSDGQRVAVQTSAFERKAEASKKSDAVKVGLGAAIGAAIGGIAGGGKGAATGAGVGGAAGAGQVLLTRGKEASLGVEARLSFRLQEPVTLTERLNN